MAKKTATKIFAFLALFGILIGVVGTGLLFFFGGNGGEEVKTITPEELQNLINSGTGIEIDNSIEDIINSGTIEEVQTGSIEN
ncbi:MAG: hypothetical protein PHH06_00170 [Candidatus Gracilibacteria bacterium]|nr:hypothetical protein [Candidatus Gracilibacteria bacterium]